MAGQYPDKIKTLPLFDGRFDAYKLAAQGSDVLFASYPAGTSIPAHVHDTDNYGVITRGALQLTIDGQTRTYGVGDWYQVAAGVVHAAEFAEATDEIEFWFKPSARQGEPQSWNRLVPELEVNNYAESRQFYQELFGFTLCFERAEDRFGYFDLNGAQIMLLEQSATAASGHERPAPKGKGLHFQVELESIEEVLQRLQQAGIPLSKEVYEAWYRGNGVEYGQREFFVTDPDGYLFRFYESIGERPAQS